MSRSSAALVLFAFTLSLPAAAGVNSRDAAPRSAVARLSAAVQKVKRLIVRGFDDPPSAFGATIPKPG
jgi:hypothetical protein